jgi:hypothetical protein
MSQEQTQHIAQLLFLTYTNQTDDVRKRAEDELQKLAQDVNPYYESLKAIITSLHPDITLETKNAAAINLRKFISSIVKEGKVLGNDRSILAQNLISLIQTPNLDAKIKSSLGYALNPLIAVDEEDPQASTFQSLAPMVMALLQADLSGWDAAFRTIRAAYSAMSYNPYLSQYYKFLENSLVEVGSKLIIELGQAVFKSDQATALQSASTLNEWAQTITNVVEHFEIANKSMLNEVIQNAGIADLFAKILLLNIPDPKMATACLIYTDVNEIGAKLNSAKTHILESLNLIIQYLIESKKEFLKKEAGVENVKNTIGVSLPDCPFVHQLMLIIEPLISSLILLGQREDLSELLEVEYITSMLVELILVLHKLSSEQAFFQIFSNYYKPLIVNACLMLLKCDQNDLESFNESPQEFTSMSLDVCEQQESETYKSCAAQLLEHICSYIDGALTFTTMYISQTIDMCLTRAGFDKLSNYPLLSELSSSAFLRQTEEIKMETSILCLCILSYQLQRRRDLLNFIELLFTQHMGTLHEISSNLVKSRLCLFVYFYAEHIYLANLEQYSSLLRFLFNCLRPDAVSVAVNIQACETLSYVVQEEDVLIRIDEILPELVYHMVCMIPQQRERAFYEALQQLSESCTELLISHIPDLIEGLKNKIIQELERQRANEKPNKKQSSIIIVKCWNIIRTISESKELSNEQLLVIEDKLIPLFEFLNDPSKIDFDDDIILFEITIMRRTQTVSKTAWILFPCLAKVQAKYENSFIQLYPALNCYIYYGREVLANSPAYVEMIVDMCTKCMFSKYKGKVNEATHAEACLILQVLMQCLIGSIDNFLPRILENTIIRLMQEINTNFLTARLLDTILCAFNYNAKLTFKILSDSRHTDGRSFLILVCEQILNNQDKFTAAYDKKMVVLGLCNVIQQQEIPAEITPLITPLFVHLITVLARLDNKKQQDSMKIDVQHLYAGKLYIDSDEESSVSVKGSKVSIRGKSHNDLKNQETEAKLALGTIITPLNEFDEYDFFRQVIGNISKLGQALQMLVSQLQKHQVEQLTEILQRKRVALINYPTQTDVRKVVKAKHKAKS